MQRKVLMLAIAQLLLLPDAWADTESARRNQEAARTLDAITVQADPLRSAYGELLKPASLLTGEELEWAKAGTLGETLQRLPGVQSSYFGPGASRPVIRGQDGARVQMLQDGLSSMDVSTVSVDHAVAIEPFLAEQIEVLRGPATLLYGPGAIGGVVNVLDGRIAERAGERGFSGRAQIGIDSVADSRFGMARMEAGSSTLVLRADAYYRTTSDYDIPGRAEIDADDDEPEGTLENSALDARGGSVGLSFIGESGFLGVSVSGFRTDYGVPGHGHHEHDDHDDHAAPKRFALKDGDDHDDEEEFVRIDLKQARVDLKGGLEQPWSGTESLRFRLARNDYEHTEFEGDEVGTVFKNEEWTGRVDLVHAEVNGWRGAYGISFGARDFSAFGEEAFVPPSDTDQIGLFLLERKQFDGWTLALGGRYDRQSITVKPSRERARHSGFSLSAGASMDLADGVALTANLDRAVRAPTAEELFSDGPHAATASFEIGDPDLDEEIANQIDVGLKFRGDRFNGSVNLFHSRFRDFIYLADTGEEEDELPVRVWNQGDARFTGWEAETTWHVADNDLGHFDLRLMTDRVRARLRDGGDLPRIPHARVGAELQWHDGPWRASFGALHYFEQDRVAEFESPSSAFTLLHAAVSYSIAGSNDFEIYLKGENLGDREARLHTSVLKELAPLPGRNLMLGLRAWF